MGPLKWQQFCSQPLKNSRTRKEAGTTTTTKRLALHCKKKKKRERDRDGGAYHQTISALLILSGRYCLETIGRKQPSTLQKF